MLSRRTFLLTGGLVLTFPRLALGAPAIGMDGLYEGDDFSEQARLFNGTEVTLDGFMAPPLKADARFFVLGTEPMVVCPFCDSSAEWPQNIVLVYPKDSIRPVGYDQAITVTGKLDLGVKTDEDTGFVSKVRVVEASYKGKPTISIGF